MAVPDPFSPTAGSRLEQSLPDEGAVLPLAADENFSVAGRLLGRETRIHLLAIYGFARLADQVGDEARGDRLALLDLLEEELGLAFEGAARHPLLRRLQPTLRGLELPRDPFLRLIEANRRDQATVAYRTFDDLVGYCKLSANPVGELVLHVFGAATPQRVELSDRVCTALQLIEHCQDVAEDYRRERIYIPAEDLERFGVPAEELGAASSSEAVRALLAFEVTRAQRLLDEGAPLVGTLRGRARFAVAGYVGGGRANAEAIVAAGHDVLSGAPKAGKARRLRATISCFRSGR